LACKSGFSLVVRCFGITKDPKTNNFMMVMELKNCSLRQYLNDSFNSIDWNKKSNILWCISLGLREIHNSGLMHHDFHCGNILEDFNSGTCITDLGLCKPANAEPSQDSHKKIYGVLPYVAPEVLRGREYTQASDIYGFGIIAYETCTGLPPYHDVAHNEFLAMKICLGLRPKSNYKIPQLILDVIERCWDADPSNRPKADDLFKSLNDLFKPLLYNHDYSDEYKNSVIYKQIKEADEINKKSFSIVQSTSSTSSLSYMTHPQAVYTSRLLNFKNLPVPRNADNNDNLCGIECSGKYIQFTKVI
jgi:serine/threonine protein kinase